MKIKTLCPAPLVALAAPVAVSLAFSILATPTLVYGQAFKKDPEKLDIKIRNATDYLVTLQRNRSTRIPPQILANARGVIIIHQFKAGLGFGFQAGSGLATVRDPQTGAWSPPAFVANVEGSYGFQIGGQKSDTVLLLMDDRGMELLKGGGAKLGFNVRATAGPSSAGGEFKADTIKEPVLVYSDAGGLYAGAAIEGGGIGPADKANAVYYGASMREILFGGKGHWSEAGKELIEKIIEYSRGTNDVAPPVQAPVAPPAQ
jgi:lipid-binding SYLF domain-containing protein